MITTRCVNFPDAEGIWVELKFVPASMTAKGNVMEPNRYMVSNAKVYSIVGDWAVRIDGMSSKATPKHDLGWQEVKDDGSVTRWFHLSHLTLGEIQLQFCQKAKIPCQFCNDLGCKECDPHKLEMREAKSKLEEIYVSER